ncbi:MAG: ComF family protein [Bacteroidales bacterium]|nr:ComF family protein [Bacteroidales bacterium]
MSLTAFFKDFFHLFYPSYCCGCGTSLVNGEKVICLQCLQNLPLTHFHLQKNNMVEKTLMGRIPYERATAYCYFQKGSIIQHAIHQLKYKGNWEVGVILGEMMGQTLMESPDFANIDIIIPIPIHPKKQAKRGYNQSEMIGKGLQKSMHKPLDTTSFIRLKNTSSQTKKTRYSRWKNVEDIFRVIHPENLQNKHILLIDDVITTGSTLEAAAACLLRTNNVKISIACLACANH